VLLLVLAAALAPAARGLRCCCGCVHRVCASVSVAAVAVLIIVVAVR
jgi:hypothetical protein